ncbi:Optic atrophy 1, isoform A, partial [Rhizophlyctis rosea]
TVYRIDGKQMKPEDTRSAVENLSRKYLTKYPSAIICCIHSAEGDAQHNFAFNLAQEVDPSGERTMCILTHMDKEFTSEQQVILKDLITKRERQGRGKFGLGIFPVVTVMPSDASNQNVQLMHDHEEALRSDTSKFFGQLSSTTGIETGIKALEARLANEQIKRLAGQLPGFLSSAKSVVEQAERKLKELPPEDTNQSVHIKVVTQVTQLIRDLQKRTDIRTSNADPTRMIYRLFAESTSKTLEKIKTHSPYILEDPSYILALSTSAEQNPNHERTVEQDFTIFHKVQEELHAMGLELIAALQELLMDEVGHLSASVYPPKLGELVQPILEEEVERVSECASADLQNRMSAQSVTAACGKSQRSKKVDFMVQQLRGVLDDVEGDEELSEKASSKAGRVLPPSFATLMECATESLRKCGHDGLIEAFEEAMGSIKESKDGINVAVIDRSLNLAGSGVQNTSAWKADRFNILRTLCQNYVFYTDVILTRTLTSIEDVARRWFYMFGSETIPLTVDGVRGTAGCDQLQAYLLSSLLGNEGLMAAVQRDGYEERMAERNDRTEFWKAAKEILMALRDVEVLVKGNRDASDGGSGVGIGHRDGKSPKKVHV